MPKRAITPPPANDEPKYLTVVHPYPLHAHMELPKDREDFGRWLACCIGPDPFYAFFYKPSALNMVIIEIKREFDSFDHLLGEHRWIDFLKNPSEEEREIVTQVFYCTYNSGRQVQKHGWKRVDAQESWFRNWSPINDIITYPYPKTHYCNPPIEDKTNDPLCRPLPVSSFSQPQASVQAASRPAPPGSTGWIKDKTIKPPPALKAWSKGLPTSLKIPPEPRFGQGPSSSKKSASPTKANSNDGSRITSPWSQAATSPLSSTLGSAASPNPWNRGPISSASPGAELATSLPCSQSNLYLPGRSPDAGSSAVKTTTTAPAVPPGFSPIPSDPPSEPPVSLSWVDISSGISDPAPASWADDIPPGLFPDVVVHNPPSTLPPIFYPNSQSPEVADSLEDAFAELGLADPAWGYPATWEYPETPQTNEPETYVSESLWRDYEEEKPVVQELLCTDHGKICKRGICKTYGKQLREAEKAKKMAERSSASGSRGKGRGKGRGNSRDENHSNWRRGSKDGVPNNDRPKKDRPAAPVGWGTNDPSPVNTSSADDGVWSSSKHGRSRAGSVDSDSGSVNNGWGPIKASW